NAGRGDWRKMVHDGFASGSAWPAMRVSSLKLPAVSFEESQLSVHPGKLEVNFTADGSVYDGRFANSGWLQELPDPMTKIVWDNAAIMGAATATELGVSHESMVRVEVEGNSLELPVYVMPGHAPGSVTLPLGYGRTAAGQIAGIAGIANDMAEQNVDSVGFDTYKIRPMNAQYHASEAKVSATGNTYSLVSTQDHHIIDEIGAHGRDERLKDLIREGDLSEYESHPDFAQHRVHHPPLNSMWEERKYENVHKWGLSIDLAACTGCAGCTIACQSENNIAVVGKKQVSMGRELHWIRMDRYFRGPIEDPQVTSQPIACHHCEMAPCEQVCPVAATTHTSEGLNDMIYNRCVGTRYCANNCPYKVRRYNYHLYSEAFQEEGNEVLKMVNNPEVTVRSRGVMEKCTYCVQRIQIARVESKNEEREIRDGEIAPACAQVCPTQAITFGDLNLEGSAVRKAFDNPRTYELLGELNLDTRTRYMAPIRNPHPSLVEASTEHSTSAGHGEHQEAASHG
ncbi:MAG: 4Fe-4S dicluster domain-containing protein, partial [Planctomycetota bacterium]|nr:4Fe-4S dicluster domain-containing protein [Planctomycetota bacterium]